MSVNRTHGDYIWYGFWISLILTFIAMTIGRLIRENSPMELLLAFVSVILLIILAFVVIYISGWGGLFIYDGVREWRDTDD